MRTGHRRRANGNLRPMSHISWEKRRRRWRRIGYKSLKTRSQGSTLVMASRGSPPSQTIPSTASLPIRPGALPASKSPAKTPGAGFWRSFFARVLAWCGRTGTS